MMIASVFFGQKHCILKVHKHTRKKVRKKVKKIKNNVHLIVTVVNADSVQVDVVAAGL